MRPQGSCFWCLVWWRLRGELDVDDSCLGFEGCIIYDGLLGLLFIIYDGLLGLLFIQPLGFVQFFD
jgi:hypothetical protein